MDPIYAEAIAQLSDQLVEAQRRCDRESHTGALATADSNARPSVRTVNVCRVAPSGLAIFVNTRTGKGQQLTSNPHAAICFHWRVLERQAIVEGEVVWLNDTDAEALWSKQPREFCMGHWLSDQTHAATEPAALRKAMHDLKKRYGSEQWPRPPDWRAFELRPNRIDLWSTGWDRVLPRMHYAQSVDGRWTRSELGA